MYELIKGKFKKIVTDNDKWFQQVNVEITIDNHNPMLL